jgi:hypothetical protein
LLVPCRDGECCGFAAMFGHIRHRVCNRVCNPSKASGRFALKLADDRERDNAYLVLRGVIRYSMSGEFLCHLR